MAHGGNTLSVALFRAQFPEFSSVFEDEEEVYSMLGEFAGYVIDKVYAKQEYKHYLRFIDEAYAAGNQTTRYYISVYFMERLMRYPAPSRELAAALTGEAALDFARMLAGA